MAPDKIISHLCAVLLIASSIALAFIQVLDIKDVANGTLMYIAQAFMLAGSIFGLNYYLQKLKSVFKNAPKDITQVIVILLMLAPTIASAQMVTVTKPAYTSHYDLGLLSPRQVTWTLHASDIGNVNREPSWKFQPDLDDPRAKARHEDYTKSGYDRGHLCPAADRSFQICAMRSTFTTSNICPQVPTMNRGSWKHTEEWCRNAAVQFDSICVLVVPIWLDRDTTFIGKHRLAVPHAFFKAAWLPKKDSVINTWFIFNK